MSLMDNREKPAVDELEVLFEYSGSRIVVITELTLLVEAIESELSKLGVEAVVCLSNTGIEGENVMLLQRFDNKWQAFLNVEELEEITNGDKITVTLKPSAYSTTKVGFRPHKQNSLFPRPACMTK